MLDIGCGASQSTRDAARAAAPGTVLGVDISEPLLERARRRTAEQGLPNATYERGDAQVHPFAPASFDVLISRFGTMFFADPAARDARRAPDRRRRAVRLARVDRHGPHAVNPCAGSARRICAPDLPRRPRAATPRSDGCRARHRGCCTPSMHARIGSLLVAVGMLVVPLDAAAETCTLYQKWRKDYAGAGLCANQPSYFEVTPQVKAQGPTFFARKVPKCLNGTDANCAAPEVLSLDGTRAFYYVDPHDVGSPNNWVIAFEGGGSCGAMRGDTAGVACMHGTENADPTLTYGFNGYNTFDPTDPDYMEMTTKHANGLYVIPDRRGGGGILNPSGANLFKGYNRVIVNKSSFDRFMGNRTTTAVYDATDSVAVNFHGRRIISTMLADLDRRNGVIEVGNNCLTDKNYDCQQLENFSLADRVVVVGHSGGSGGLIHNMEWIKSQILSRAPNAKVFFLLGSRMMPWLEAEAAWWSAANGIWDDVYFGTSTIDGNVGTPNAIIQYGPSAYQSGGLVRTLLTSWGDSTSPLYPFLDTDCKVQHGNTDWRCFDEGHVALYHMNENVFWYESLLDGVHNAKSPASWIDSANGVNLFNQGGFLFDPDGATTYTRARGERILYAGESMLQQHPGTGWLAFYLPFLNCHSAVFGPSFTTDAMTKNNTNATINTAFHNWVSAIAAGMPEDQAWVDDSQSLSPWFWSSNLYGGGWTSPANCTQ